MTQGPGHGATSVTGPLRHAGEPSAPPPKPISGTASAHAPRPPGHHPDVSGPWRRQARACVESARFWTRVVPGAAARTDPATPHRHPRRRPLSQGATHPGRLRRTQAAPDTHTIRCPSTDRESRARLGPRGARQGPPPGAATPAPRDHRPDMPPPLPAPAARRPLCRRDTRRSRPRPAALVPSAPVPPAARPSAPTPEATAPAPSLAQPLGRRVHTTVISPVTAPSARRISIVTGNSGRSPASSWATTSVAGRPRVAVAVTAPIASFL
ncbi:hypothetical protein SAURM35S_04914 [Streptomyces aurantiogriseus]